MPLIQSGSNKPCTARRSLLSGLAVLAVTVVTGLPSAAMANDRSIDTAFGPVSVKSAARVVTLDEGALDTALALGVQPVGSVAVRGGTDLPGYLQDYAENIAIVGTTREPNLEAILSQRPDLILAPPGLEKRVYDVLSKMAPTIVPTVPSTAPWQERNAIHVAALGKQDEMQERIKEVEARIDALRERIEPGQTFSIVRWNPQGPIAMSDKLITGQILMALGMKSTELAAGLGERPHSDTLSLEHLGRVDADWLFIATLNQQGEKTLEAAKRQLAFNRLQAVQRGQAATVDGQYWSSSTGILAALQILDDIERIILQ